MFSPLLTLTLLGLVSAHVPQPYWAPASPTPTPRLTNAERLRLGLTPRRPSRLFKPNRPARRDSTPSGTPTQTKTGYLYAIQPGQPTEGCMISDGSYFIGGTCATYAQVLTGSSFTLTTHQGSCGIASDKSFVCSSTQSATTFTQGSDGLVYYGGSDVFSTDAIPPDNTRATVFAGAGNVALNLEFVEGAQTTSTSSTSSTASSTSSTSTAYPTGTGLTVCNKPASSYPLSCSGATGQDTCCYDSPGGHILQTQFWDTGSTSTGPNNSWTVHGLWPDNCDGTFSQYCDVSRENSNIRGTLQSFGQTDLLAYMDVYWKDYQGNDESFWEHEWDKHGTCMSSLDPQCFNNYTAEQEVVSFFQKAVATFKTLPTYDWLAADGILPSLTKTYTLDEMETALAGAFGHQVTVNCDGSVFDEVWYHYDSQGGIPSGNLVPADPVGSGSTCPSTGIQYYPKYTDLSGSTSTSSTTSTTSTSTGTPSSTSSASASKPTDGERGFVYPTESDGSRPSGTCLINAGVWYSGTCGGYHVETQSDGTFKFKTNGGYCAVQNDILGCTGSVTQATASTFGIDANGVISYEGSTAFSASQVPSGSTKVNITADASEAIKLTLVYVGPE